METTAAADQTYSGVTTCHGTANQSAKLSIPQHLYSIWNKSRLVFVLPSLYPCMASFNPFRRSDLILLVTMAKQVMARHRLMRAKNQNTQIKLIF